MRTYFWDFFGPRAQGTAEHFQRHLDEFLVRFELTGCTSGLTTRGPGHHAATCHVPPEHQPAIEQALKPRRWEEGPGG